MKQNKTIIKHFKWLTSSEQQKLKQLLLMKSAIIYEQSENWHHAAECWKQLGKYVRASNLYQKANNIEAAAKQLLDAEKYNEALEYYEKWEKYIYQGDNLNQYKLLLGKAACHFLGSRNIPNGKLSRTSGKKFYWHARKIFDQEKRLNHKKTELFRIALAEYAKRLQRYDLIQEAYDFIVNNIDLNQSSNTEIQILKDYLSLAKYYTDDLKVKLIEEKSDFILDNTFKSDNFPEKWTKYQQLIESFSFTNGIHDVIHFTNNEQRQAWKSLSEIENIPEVNAYMQTLSPKDMKYISPGSFQMGCDHTPDSKSDETPQHSLWLSGYYIDSFPVTNLQFKKFMDAGGYQTRGFWTKKGWEEKEENDWKQPRHFYDDRFNKDNHPVVSISWYEAYAYSQWAIKSLPTSPEWEKSASWNPFLNKKYIYPWGDKWECERCHTQETGIYGTVEISKYYPLGDSCYKVSDLAGNVKEWCSTISTFSYPYISVDGRENVEGSGKREVKGASWNDKGENKWSRCSIRAGLLPNIWGTNIGFRCVYRV